MGPPVFKTGGAAPGVARWVRLPCAPAIPALDRTTSSGAAFGVASHRGSDVDKPVRVGTAQCDCNVAVMTG